MSFIIKPDLTLKSAYGFSIFVFIALKKCLSPNITIILYSLQVVKKKKFTKIPLNFLLILDRDEKIGFLEKITENRKLCYFRFGLCEARKS